MHLNDLTLDKLRKQWAKEWRRTPHVRIGRVMLEKSLAYKLQANLSDVQNKQLNKLVKQYKNNPKCFDVRSSILKTGTQLTRIYNGKKHSVIVCENGFEYNGQRYNSLSKIANHITDSKWNGWVFFGLKS